MCTRLWTRVIIIGVEVRPAATFEREKERERGREGGGTKGWSLEETRNHKDRRQTDGPILS